MCEQVVRPKDANDALRQDADMIAMLEQVCVTILYYAMLWYAVLCYVYYAILCYVYYI